MGDEQFDLIHCGMDVGCLAEKTKGRVEKEVTSKSRPNQIQVSLENFLLLNEFQTFSFNNLVLCLQPFLDRDTINQKVFRFHISVRNESAAHGVLEAVTEVRCPARYLRPC